MCKVCGKVISKGAVIPVDGENKKIDVAEIETDKTIKSKTNGGAVHYGEKAFKDDSSLELRVDKETKGDKVERLTKNTAKDSFVLYDISIISAGKKVQPKESVWVSVPLPSGFDPASTYIFFVDDDLKFEKLPSFCKDGKIFFEAAHFSDYAIVNEDISKVPDYKLGDVDGSGMIDSADARLALRRAVNLESYKEGTPEFLACDVDFSGDVTPADARLILRAAVKLDNPEKDWVKK